MHSRSKKSRAATAFQPRMSPPPTYVPNPTQFTANLRFMVAQLRQATTLGTVALKPVLRFVEVLYPCDEEDRPLPLNYDSWVEYARNHVFLEHISCFCVLQTGVPCAVKMIRPLDSSKNTFYLGCLHWNGKGGCGYFIDMRERFEKRLYMQETKLYEKKPRDTNQILNTANTYSVAHMKAISPPVIGYPRGGPGLSDEIFADIIRQGTDLDEVATVLAEVASAGDATKIPYDPRPPVSAMQLTPSAKRDLEQRSWLPFVVPGFVGDPKRIHESSIQDLRHVYHTPTPTWQETAEIFRRLFSPTNPGVAYAELMKHIGACNECGQLVAFCVFREHVCVADSLGFRGLGASSQGSTTSTRTSSPGLFSTPWASPPSMATSSSPFSSPLPPSSPPPSSTPGPSTPNSQLSVYSCYSGLGKRHASESPSKEERRARVKVEFEDPEREIFRVDED